MDISKFALLLSTRVANNGAEAFFPAAAFGRTETLARAPTEGALHIAKQPVEKTEEILRLVTQSGHPDSVLMSSLLPYLLFGLLFVIAYKISGVPKLMGAYPDKPEGKFQKVGVFSLARERAAFRGAIFSVSANRNGLLLHPLWPLWLRGAYIPWGDIWLRDAANPLRPNKQIGFLGCPDVTYFITSLFKAKVERTIKSQVPI